MNELNVKQLVFTCALTLSAAAANAQENVVLTAIDGSISVQGKLIEFVDQKYTIDTLAGTLTIDSSVVICSGEACPSIRPQLSEFSVEGTGTLASGLVADLLPIYAQSLDGQVSGVNSEDAAAFTVADAQGQTLATISLVDSSSSAGLNSLIQGQAAIALTSRQISADELSEFEKNGEPFESSKNEHVIGLDAITIVTAQDNPLDTISLRDAALIFSGAYSNWSELGGMDAPINLYGPPADSELTDLFVATVIESQGDDISNLSQDMVTNDDVAAVVADDPNGIGYTHFSKSRSAKTMAIEELCGLTKPANSFSIKSEEYPLTHRIYAYSETQSGESQVDALLGFLQSDVGQTIASSHNLVDQRGIKKAVSNQGLRFANAINVGDTEKSHALLRQLVSQVFYSDRLSTTFRFETGSNQMDQRAKVDIIRLVEKLGSQDNSDTVVHLHGFTDSVGDFELNQELSQRRADQVRDALVEVDAKLLDRIKIQSSGYGEIAPIACNETALGRSINRRVEVWMGSADTSSTQ